MTPEFRTPLPRMSFVLARVVAPIHRFFDWLYHSRYNPLYRSGTLAVGFLVLLLFSGLYLVFFYSVSAPYESLVEIQSQRYLGRWMRALHRYATGGVIVVTVFHILQLLIQGKTWGPRTLAWLSGIVLVGVVFLSAWTGYVLVWDTHGQRIAQSGAAMLQLFPFLRDVLASAFDGTTPVTPSFFFMNLFLHLALPIGIIFGLWVHTAKISRSRWFPLRPIFFWSAFGFIALAVFWPAGLLPKADLLSIPGIVPSDIFAGFWLPIVDYSPKIAFAFFLTLTGVLALMPWWCRPAPEQRRKSSVVDADRCTGCTQCARDCPYEAIIMRPRDDGRRLIAEVRPGSCVSCGICAASCNDICVGPPERSGREQLEQAEEFCARHFPEPRPEDITIIACKHNGAAPDAWQSFAESQTGCHLYFADCCGTVHTQVMEKLFEKCGGIFFHACPERNCFNRDGLDLLTQRVFFKRVPFLARNIDRKRLGVDASSEREMPLALSHLARFRTSLSVEDSGSTPSEPNGWIQVARRVAATILLLPLFGFLSNHPLGKHPDYAVVRLGGKFPGQSAVVCRPLSEEEKRTLPLHMQQPQLCEQRQRQYTLRISADGRELFVKTPKSSNLRGDGKIFVSEDVHITPGAHDIAVHVEEEDEPGKQKILTFEQRITALPGRIYLVRYEPEINSLVLVQ